jgi:hypothetical protein
MKKKEKCIYDSINCIHDVDYSCNFCDIKFKLLAKEKKNQTKEAKYSFLVIFKNDWWFSVLSKLEIKGESLMCGDIELKLSGIKKIIPITNLDNIEKIMAKEK